MADPSKADSSGRVAAVEEGGKTWWDTVILVSGIVGALFFIPVSVLTQYSKSWAVLELTLISLFLFLDILVSPLGLMCAMNWGMSSVADPSLLALFIASVARLLFASHAESIPPDARYGNRLRWGFIILWSLMVVTTFWKWMKTPVIPQSEEGWMGAWMSSLTATHLNTESFCPPLPTQCTWIWSQEILFPFNIVPDSLSPVLVSVFGESPDSVCLHNSFTARWVVALSFAGCISMLLSDSWTLTSPTALTDIQTEFMKGLVHSKVEFKDTSKTHKHWISYTKVTWDHRDTEEHQVECDMQISQDPCLVCQEISQNPGPPNDQSLVLIHGLGAGQAYFAQSLDTFAQYFGGVYCIDLPGMAGSARPCLPQNLLHEVDEATMDKVREIDRRSSSSDATSEPQNPDSEDTTKAIAYFVKRVEDWREEIGLQKITLLGHSFGGYIAAWYALVFPEHIERLILVSPMGVPSCPDYWCPNIPMKLPGIPQKRAKVVCRDGVSDDISMSDLGSAERDCFRVGPPASPAVHPENSLSWWWDTMLWRMIWTLGGTPHNLLVWIGFAAPQLANDAIFSKYRKAIFTHRASSPNPKAKAKWRIRTPEAEAESQSLHSFFMGKNGRRTTVPPVVDCLHSASSSSWLSTEQLLAVVVSIFIILLLNFDLRVGLGLIATVFALFGVFSRSAHSCPPTPPTNGEVAGVRSPNVPKIEFRKFSDYFYHINVIPVCSTWLLFQYLCFPVGYALRPMGHRLVVSVKCPTFFLYGEHDWIPFERYRDPKDCEEPPPADDVGSVSRGIDDRLRQENAHSEFNQNGLESFSSVYTIKDSGHLPMLQNIRGFQTAVLRCCGFPQKDSPE